MVQAQGFLKVYQAYAFIFTTFFLKLPFTEQ